MRLPPALTLKADRGRELRNAEPPPHLAALGLGLLGVGLRAGKRGPGWAFEPRRALQAPDSPSSLNTPPPGRSCSSMKLVKVSDPILVADLSLQSATVVEVGSSPLCPLLRHIEGL